MTKDIMANTVGHKLNGSLLKKFIAPITLSFSKLLPFAQLGKYGGVFALIVFVLSSERFLEQMRLAREEFRVKTGLATIIEMKAWQKEQKKRAKAAAKAAKVAR